MYGRTRSGGTVSFTRNISLSRSLRVSTCLGVNWASGATKLTFARAAYSGAMSKTMRASAPILTFTASWAGR